MQVIAKNNPKIIKMNISDKIDFRQNNQNNLRCIEFQIKFAGPSAHRRVRSRVQPWSVLFCFQTAQSGRPRALGGQSRCDAVAATSPQSPARPWRPVICDGSCRRIHDHPSKCKDSSRRSTWILQTAFLKNVVNLTHCLMELFCPLR